MPHGDFSDYAAFFCLGNGLASIFAPQVYFQQLGPLKPFFDNAATAEATAALKFSGGLLMFMGLVLFVNRWNTLNGKAGGLGCLIASVNCASIAWGMDGAFVPRGWHIHAVVFLLGFLHLSFNANPIWTSVTLAAKEKERAAKKAAKNK
jgi:hypothetical protein